MKKTLIVSLKIFCLLICCPAWGQEEGIIPIQNESKRLESYADSCFNKGDISSAEATYSLLYEMFDSLEKHDVKYASIIYNISRCKSKKGEYAEAVKLGRKALEIQKEILGEEHPDYVASLNNLAINYCELDDFTEAIKMGEEALRIADKIHGKKHIDYATSLNTLSWAHSCIGNNKEAIRLESEALKIRKKTLGIKHPDYATSLSHLALYKNRIGNTSEAIRLETEAMEIRKNSIGLRHRDYAISLDNLSSYYSEIGNYTEALELGLEALNIRKEVLGCEHDEYAISLHNVATYNAYLGNYEEAVKLESMAIDVICKQKGKDGIVYLSFLNVLSAFTIILGDYEGALNLSEEVLRTSKLKYGYETPIYAAALVNKAKSYLKMGNYDQAVICASEAIRISKSVHGESHPDYAWYLSQLANIYFEMCNYDKSRRTSKEAMKIAREAFGEDNIDYISSLYNLARCNLAIRNFPEASEEIVKTIDFRANHLINIFSHLPFYRRVNLWNEEKAFFLNDIPLFAYQIKNPVLISSLFDNSALLAKGILLNTEIEMKKLIDESGDPELYEIYQTLLSNHEIFEKQSNIPIEDRIIDTDSLKQVIQSLEDELIKKSKAYGDYTSNLKISWRNIQKSLGDNDIAIEFLDFPMGKDSIMYVALTVKKEYDNPRLISLFELRQLKSINENAFYRTSRLAKLVWGPLEEELAGVRNVYFSPSGELHRIGIEYLPLNANEYIFDKYQLQRFSSTRQLVMSKESTHKKRAMIYGGIDYDAALAYNINTFSENKASNSNVQIDFLSIRGGREYLKGTKVEADSISSELEHYKWECTYYSGSNGTEENFKGLSGNCPSLLHIATHGFYMTREDAKKEQEIALLESKERSLNNRSAIREDKPMTRSGLLLSGCNHTLNHEPVPENREDGVLTAQEIATLDLRGLDLVVLSACETGLGDISSGEGVFGLQRGFKKAGAKTIVMSLWKVADSATQKLMTNFYQNYLGGMSKYDAFTTAREELRQTCPPRQNRPDWAAFIMLDGIN